MGNSEPEVDESIVVTSGTVSGNMGRQLADSSLSTRMAGDIGATSIYCGHRTTCTLYHLRRPPPRVLALAPLSNPKLPIGMFYNEASLPNSCLLDSKCKCTRVASNKRTDYHHFITPQSGVVKYYKLDHVLVILTWPGMPNMRLAPIHLDVLKGETTQLATN